MLSACLSLVVAGCSSESRTVADGGARDGGAGTDAAVDAGAWDAGPFGTWELPPNSPVTLSPRGEDGTLSGTYTATLGLGLVRFRVHATGPESAVATYETDDARITAHITDATHGYVIVNDEEDLPLDGYGASSTMEQAFTYVLAIPPIGWAARDVPLALGCSTGFLAAELEALIFPWQLVLKYGTTERTQEILTATELSSCGWFVDPIEEPTKPRSKSEYLQLGFATPIPHVFGFFPFDDVGAFEAPKRKGLPGGLVCVLDHSADDSAKGVCGSMCAGSCAGYCSPLHCEKTEIFPPDCCTTPAGNAIPYSSRRAIYVCTMDADCADLDNCYENCNNSKGCGTWAAFSCKHDLTDPGACDVKVCDSYGKATCARWISGTGPFTTTRTFKYHSEPQSDPACAPSGCLAAGSLVSMASGERVPIEQVAVGDRVLAAELEDRRIATAQVEEVLVHRDGPYAIDRLVSAEGDELDLTPSHPVWTVDRGFVPASELVAGDLLLRVDADTGVPKTALLLAIVRAVSEVDVVYNLKTTRGHYVAADLVVHNKCLAAGTLIDGPGGPRRVEDLRPGDLVDGTRDGRRVPSRVVRVFEKESLLPALPGKRLAPGVVVTTNHRVPTAGGDVAAGTLILPDEDICGRVYDLETETGDYFAGGVALRAAE